MEFERENTHILKAAMKKCWSGPDSYLLRIFICSPSAFRRFSLSLYTSKHQKNRAHSLPSHPWNHDDDNDNEKINEVSIKNCSYLLLIFLMAVKPSFWREGKQNSYQLFTLWWTLIREDMHVNELGERKWKGQTSVCSCKCKIFLRVCGRVDGMSHRQIGLRLKWVSGKEKALLTDQHRPGKDLPILHYVVNKIRLAIFTTDNFSTKSLLQSQ